MLGKLLTEKDPYRLARRDEQGVHALRTFACFSHRPFAPFFVHLCFQTTRIVAGFRREAARLTAELEALSRDKTVRERELSAATREKEAELSRAREEAERFSEEAEEYKKQALDAQKKVGSLSLSVKDRCTRVTLV